MKPTGVLSPRAAAYAGFNRGPIFISYGRPAVRERTVWGGTLIPFDTIWRTGANEATHLANEFPADECEVVVLLLQVVVKHDHLGEAQGKEIHFV